MFKVGDKVVRNALRRNGSWLRGNVPIEVTAVNAGGWIQFEGDTPTTWWDYDYFDLHIEPAAKFDGKPAPTPAEAVKLKGDLKKVLDCFKFHRDPMTLQFIACRTGVSELSVGSRVRDLRKPKFGGYTIERTKTGLKHEYQLKGAA